MSIFDTHAHLDDSAFAGDFNKVLERARAAGVALILNVGFDLESSAAAVGLAGKYREIYAAVGIHPHEAAGAGPDYLAELERLAAHHKAVAIGEIGLDYYRDLSPRRVQKKVFLEQLELAKKLGKPVIIHDRDAHGDVMDILRRAAPGLAGGVMHCYSGSWEMARESISLGFYISLAGPVTYPNAVRLKDLAARLPEEYLLVETDAPYLAPQAFRGKRNEPAFVVHTVGEIARLRKKDPEYIAKITAENGRRLFRID